MNLADPELELVDPTPNIHTLFIHFDKEFFWTKLVSRAVVRWSKRMYSCAGICSYEGRGGLVDVALSEPLLKLRPRKDLIETLLHEMIHAYLFVTCRDQDRDGHGPNFKAHMHRINKCAGLNISIYHSFHDEVKLYQTHVWRCNGPCQTRKPYFGIVRRSANRVPGPKDFWWDEHKRYCNGTFIKIKEPEKVKKKAVTTKKGDITKFINNNTKSKNNNNTSTKLPEKKLINPNLLTNKSNKEENIHTIKTMFGSPTLDKKSNVIIKPKFSGTGKTVNSNFEVSKQSIADITETVRNIWANKQIPNTVNTNVSTKQINTNKNKAATPLSGSPPVKMKKLEDHFKTNTPKLTKLVNEKESLNIIKVEKDMVDCPVCSTKVKSNEVNKHLDECLNKDIIEKLTNVTESKNSPLMRVEKIDNKNTLKEIAQNIQENPVIQTDSNHNKNSAPQLNTNIKSESNNNVIIDLTNIIYDSPISEPKKLLKKDNKPEKFLETNTGDLLQIKPGTSRELPKQKCPCCDDIINKSLDEHFDECLSFFDNNTTIPDEGASTSLGNSILSIDDDEDDIFDETQTFNATGTKSPCPVCLKMVEQEDMNKHLDICLS